MRKRITMALTGLLMAATAVVVGASAASASPCQLQARGTAALIRPATFTWATFSPSAQNRSICYVMALEGHQGDRYVKFVGDIQDLIDSGSGGDKYGACIDYKTPGTTVWRRGICDFNSADWIKNGDGREWGFVVDTWASGPPSGFTFRVTASDPAYPNVPGRLVTGPGIITGSW